MKVAVCFSGFFRCLYSNYNNIYENILKNYNCDVFIHTWDKLGCNLYFESDKCNAYTIDYINDIIKLYKPIYINIENNDNFKNNLSGLKAYDHRHPQSVYSMFYGIQQSNLYKSEFELLNNFTYDIVIRARTDLQFINKLNIDDNYYINIPHTGNFGGINDQFAYSNSYNMNKYSDLYNNIQYYSKINKCINPENLLLYHLNVNNVPYKHKVINYDIIRDNGIVQNNYLFEKALGFK